MLVHVEGGASVSEIKTRRVSFPLRLAKSLREHARYLASEDGVSLNHFISLAIAEKISRVETDRLKEEFESRKQR
jgi:predicted HicB family RNase H-like nuclease